MGCYKVVSTQDLDIQEVQGRWRDVGIKNQ